MFYEHTGYSAYLSCFLFILLLVEYKPHESRDFDLFIMYVPRAISGLEKSLSISDVKKG